MWNVIQPLFTLSFWFSVTALPFTPILDKVILILMLGLALGGIGILVYARQAVQEKEQRRLQKRVAALLLCAGFSGLYLYGVTWQRIPVLSMRMFFVLWAGGFGWWGYTIYRYYRIELPLQLREAREREAYEKWLPKPKK